jgi:hypothetical protein
MFLNCIFRGLKDDFFILWITKTRDNETYGPDRQVLSFEKGRLRAIPSADVTAGILKKCFTSSAVIKATNKNTIRFISVGLTI